MTDHFVTVSDSLELPTAVLVPSARISDSTAAGRAQLTAADAAAQRTAMGIPEFSAEAFTAGHTDLQAIHAACAAATAAATASRVVLSARVWDVEDGLSLSGYTCGLVGMGATSGPPGSGTTLAATTQAGAVLDLTGWLQPSSYVRSVELGNFTLSGSGVAGAGNIGLLHGDSSSHVLAGVYIHDIAILSTGGAGVDLFDLYISEMARVVVLEPTSTLANDVPYMVFRGCNGSRFNGLVCTSITGDMGASGAIVASGDDCIFTGASFEHFHVPPNGTLISATGNGQLWTGTYFIDISKASGSTGTSHVTFNATTGPYGEEGGNIWLGKVPGTNAGSPTTTLNTGINMLQSGNLVIGAKGYSGGNITLASGVGYTTIILGGRHFSGCTDPAFIDNSGQTTNVLIDHTVISEQHGKWVTDTFAPTAGANGPRFTDAAAPWKGGLGLGNGGVTIQSGTGIPSGVNGTIGSTFIDGVGTCGARRWVKTISTLDWGWVVTDGDTGWRVLTSWTTAGVITGTALPSGMTATSGVAGYVKVRRVNSTVYWSILGATYTGSGLAISAPAGFEGLDSFRGQVPAIYAGTPGFVDVLYSSCTVGPTGGGTSDSSVPTTWTHGTDSGWPTTLPGA